MKRIHIVGSGPRTGTTLLAEVMAACFKIDHTCEHESPICTEQPKIGNCLLTKQPGDFASVTLPLLINPKLFVICIMRDPRDSIASFHGSNANMYWTGLRYWKLFVKKYTILRKLPRFILIKYEDFVRDPNKAQRYIMKKIPFLDKKYLFSDYHLVANPSKLSLNALRNLRPIEPVGIGSWKNNLPRLKQQIFIHGSISKELIYFGYELDDSWEKILSEIEEVDYQTARPEYIGIKDIIKHKKRELKEVANIVMRNMRSYQ